MSNDLEYLYVGLDIHSKIVVYCVKRAGGEVVMTGTVPATRVALACWARGLPGRTGENSRTNQQNVVAVSTVNR